jgi:hypothetical protein
MKTELLDGYFGNSLLRFAIAETMTEGAAFVAWYTVVDYLRGLDDEELGYVAENLTEAIRWFIGRDKPHITDKRTLRREMERHLTDGAFCWIECEGERVFEIGDSF